MRLQQIDQSLDGGVMRFAADIGADIGFGIKWPALMHERGNFVVHICIRQQRAFAGLALDPLDKFFDRHIEPYGNRLV